MLVGPTQRRGRRNGTPAGPQQQRTHHPTPPYHTHTHQPTIHITSARDVAGRKRRRDGTGRRRREDRRRRRSGGSAAGPQQHLTHHPATLLHYVGPWHRYTSARKDAQTF